MGLEGMFVIWFFTGIVFAGIIMMLIFSGGGETK